MGQVARQVRKRSYGWQITKCGTCGYATNGYKARSNRSVSSADNACVSACKPRSIAKRCPNLNRLSPTHRPASHYPNLSLHTHLAQEIEEQPRLHTHNLRRSPRLFGVERAVSILFRGVGFLSIPFVAVSIRWFVPLDTPRLSCGPEQPPPCLHRNHDGRSQKRPSTDTCCCESVKQHNPRHNR